MLHLNSYSLFIPFDFNGLVLYPYCIQVPQIMNACILLKEASGSKDMKENYNKKETKQ